MCYDETCCAQWSPRRSVWRPPFCVCVGAGSTGSWAPGGRDRNRSGGRRWLDVLEASLPRARRKLLARVGWASCRPWPQWPRSSSWRVSRCSSWRRLAPTSPIFPSSSWEIQHSCVTAYYVAARAADDSPNVYDKSLYTAPDDNPAKIRKPLLLDSFNVDVYECPSPLPDAAALGQGRSPAVSAVSNGLVRSQRHRPLGGDRARGGSLGPAAGTRALLLSPFLLAAIPTINFLKKETRRASRLRWR